MILTDVIFAFYWLNLLIYACNCSYCCDSIVPSDTYQTTISLDDNSLLDIQCPGRNRNTRPCFQDEMQCNQVNGVNICRAIPSDCSPDFQTRDFWNTYESQYRSSCGFDSVDSRCIVEIGAKQTSDNGNGDKVHKFKIYKVGHYYDVNDDDLSRWFIFTAGKENWGNIRWSNGYNMNMDCVGRGGNGCKGDGGWSCPRQNFDTFGKEFLKHDVCNYFWRDCQDGSCSSLDTHCGDEYDDANSECLFYGKPLGKDKCFQGSQVNVIDSNKWNNINIWIAVLLILIICLTMLTIINIYQIIKKECYKGTNIPSWSEEHTKNDFN